MTKATKSSNPHEDDSAHEPSDIDLTASVSNGAEDDAENVARPPRINNACVACRRRKTKCSGGPAPCDACSRSRTYCFYNPKLDSRRKVAYKPGVVQEHQRHILLGLLQTLKYGNHSLLNSLLSLLREEAPLDQVAESICDNFEALRARQLLPASNADNFDVVSLVLSDLEKHRVRWPPKRTLAEGMDPVVEHQEDLGVDSSEETEESASQIPQSSPTVAAPHALSHQPFEGLSPTWPPDQCNDTAHVSGPPTATWCPGPAIQTLPGPFTASDPTMFYEPSRGFEVPQGFNMHERNGNLSSLAPQEQNNVGDHQLTLQTPQIPPPMHGYSQQHFPMMQPYSGNFAQ